MLRLARLGDGPEIFHSLQGEGVNAGRPSVFVRTSSCNLHCVWCDTDYTWNWEGTAFPHEREAEPGFRKFRREEQVVETTVDEAAERVAFFPCRQIVLTGGEPMLQQAALVEMMTLLRQRDPAYVFEIETNGTIRPDEAFEALAAHYNVSPKLSNSGNAENLRLRPEALRWFAASPKAWFKFVVCVPEDVAEIEALAALIGLPPHRVLLMPEGRSAAEVESNKDLVVRLCLEKGYSFSDRLHLRLFGPGRGK